MNEEDKIKRGQDSLVWWRRFIDIKEDAVDMRVSMARHRGI